MKKTIKEISKRLKLVFLILIGRIKFQQRVESFKDIAQRVKDLNLKYYPDDGYCVFKISYSNEGIVNFTMYSSHPYPKWIEDRDLDTCFKLYEEHLKSADTIKKEKEDQSPIIELPF